MDSDVHTAVMLRRLTALSVFKAGLKYASSCKHAHCMLLNIIQKQQQASSTTLQVVHLCLGLLQA